MAISLTSPTDAYHKANDLLSKLSHRWVMASSSKRIRIDATCPREFELTVLRHRFSRIALRVPVRVRLSEDRGGFLMENPELELWGGGRQNAEEGVQGFLGCLHQCL